MTAQKKAARQGGSNHNLPRNFSITSSRGKAERFDVIADTIAGQQEGSRFVRELCDGISAPDALLMRMRENLGNAAKMRGFCRALQKYIEQGPA